MKTQVFLDSGAFSAWTHGARIDIQDYIGFIKRFRKYLSVYAVLDVIGDPEATLRNQRIMEEAGLSPLPCFHYGEPLRYLERYVGEYDYVALGGMAKLQRNRAVYDFLDKCFSIVCDTTGLPQVKIHGFGISTISIMKNYPFYSVDSTSWASYAMRGCIVVPYKLPSGEWDYLEELPGRTAQAVNVAMPAVSTNGAHFLSLSGQRREEVIEWLRQNNSVMGSSSFRYAPTGYELQDNERWVNPRLVKYIMGGVLHGVRQHGKRCVEHVDVHGVSNSQRERRVVNARFYMRLQDKLPKYPWAWKRVTDENLFECRDR